MKNINITVRLAEKIKSFILLILKKLIKHGKNYTQQIHQVIWLIKELHI